MYNRYNEEIFCFIEKYINIANLVLLFFRREGSFCKGRKDSGTTWTSIQLEEKPFQRRDCYSSSYLLNITVRLSSL